MQRPSPSRVLLPAFLAALGGAAAPAAATAAPARVGPFELLHELGRGGMGRVFLGVQRDPVERLVAVKQLLEEDQDDPRFRAQFDVERRALARANHDNVARLLQVGDATDPEPWFAMELVDGEPIDLRSDALQLTLDERLALLADACDGVQHLHDVGVQHRDLKPDNVLVVSRDGRHVPKIVDLGLAEIGEFGRRAVVGAATEPRVDSVAVAQDAGASSMALTGTLTHMAPEQFGLSGERPVDGRADVFGLGVMLYQLAIGALPYPARGPGGPLALRRSPPPPSVRLRAADVDTVTVVANRRTTERRLRRRLRSGLDELALRAVAPTPAARIASPGALADGLRKLIR